MQCNIVLEKKSWFNKGSFKKDSDGLNKKHFFNIQIYI